MRISSVCNLPYRFHVNYKEKRHVRSRLLRSPCKTGELRRDWHHPKLKNKIFIVDYTVKKNIRRVRSLAVYP